MKTTRNEPGMASRARRAGLAAIVALATLCAGAGEARAHQGGAASDASPQPYVVDYYYKVKWGHAEEFLALFKKNHLPVLRKEMELGRILKVTVAAPRLHATEDGRWDYRVTITFKDAAIASDNFDSAALTRQLYPDQDAFKKEEQRRFEILDAHWDVPMKDVPLP